MATHSSILVWKISWTQEPGRLQVHGVTESWIQLSTHTLYPYIRPFDIVPQAPEAFFPNFFFFYLFYSIFIYLAVLGLSCGMKELVSCTGIEPGPPALEAWHLIDWTTRQVPSLSWVISIHLSSCSSIPF